MENRHDRIHTSIKELCDNMIKLLGKAEESGHLTKQEYSKHVKVKQLFLKKQL